MKKKEQKSIKGVKLQTLHTEKGDRVQFANSNGMLAYKFTVEYAVALDNDAAAYTAALLDAMNAEEHQQVVDGICSDLTFVVSAKLSATPARFKVSTANSDRALQLQKAAHDDVAGMELYAFADELKAETLRRNCSDDAIKALQAAIAAGVDVTTILENLQ